MKTPSSNPPLRNPVEPELSDLLEQLESSGQGVAAFARSRGLKPQNLYLARRRNKANTAQAPAFDRVRITALSTERPNYKIELPSGHKLSVPGDFDSSSLRRLLEVLEAC